MKTLSLKLDDTIFLDTEQILTKMNKPRNRYINDAIDYYNKFQMRKILSAKLEKESIIVKNESMKVLHEFELIDYED